MDIVIYGDPRTKKNSSRIIRKDGRFFVIPSKAYSEYEKAFLWQCETAGIIDKKIDKACNIKCIYYMKTKRKVDLTNLLSGTMDCLVRAGVIDDDNCKIAASHDGSRVYYDKENPRVEIYIEEL